MFSKRKTEALVVGAGPVGLFTAASLVRQGLDVQIVDGEWRRTGMSYALGLHPSSMELLEDLDLAEPIQDEGYRVDTIAFYEGTERRAEVDYRNLGGKYPYLTVLPQSVLEQGLTAWLKQHKVKVQWRHRVADIADVDRPTSLTLEKWDEDSMGYAVARKERVIDKTFQVASDFIVGADGHSSIVRRRLGVDFPELESPLLFAVYEFETSFDAGHEAKVVLNPDSTNVFWPLPHGRCRWSFQLHDPSEFEGPRMKSRLSELGRWVFPALDQARLETLLRERAPWFSGIQEIMWSIAIRFERRLAARFGRGALWLAGDSAHLASPLGIHSMNVGMREGRDLAAAVAGVVRHGASEEALETYEADRQAEWRRLLGQGDGPSAGADATPFVRNNLSRIIGAVPASGANLDALLGQLGVEL